MFPKLKTDIPEIGSCRAVQRKCTATHVWRNALQYLTQKHCNVRTGILQCLRKKVLRFLSQCTAIQGEKNCKAIPDEKNHKVWRNISRCHRDDWWNFSVVPDEKHHNAWRNGQQRLMESISMSDEMHWNVWRKASRCQTKCKAMADESHHEMWIITVMCDKPAQICNKIQEPFL